MLRKLFAGDNIYFLKLFKFAKPHAFRYAVGQLLYSSQGFVFPFAMALLAGNIMAAIVAADSSLVISAVINFAILICTFFLFLSIGVYNNIITIEMIMMDVKQALFRSFVRSGIEDATASHSGEKLAAINTDANTAQGIFAQPLTEFISSLMGIVGSAIVIFAVDLRLGSAAFVVGVLSFVMQHRYTKPLAQIGRDKLAINADATKNVGNFFTSAMVIRAYNMQPGALLTFDKENKRLKLLDVKRGYIEMWRDLFTSLQGWMSLVITFALGGWLVTIGALEFHMLMVVLGMFGTFVSSIGRIGRTYADLQAPIAGAKRLFDILDKNVNTPIKKESAAGKPNGYTIAVRNLNFTYANAKSAALTNINMDIHENEMIAFVGESGSGKSTLMRTIIGMYERKDLGLQLGDLRFSDIPIKNWRYSFAYVDQSCKLFDMTVKENIAIGVGGRAEDEKIIAAAKLAAAHEFIEELDGAYDAPCGEKGSTLSGGQKQRIAIARALIKGAPILVFDEATSALDEDSERSVMDTIQSLRNNHTIMIATHNLKTIQNADRIIVMDKGKIVETGKHDELMKIKGFYYNLAS